MKTLPEIRDLADKAKQAQEGQLPGSVRSYAEGVEDALRFIAGDIKITRQLAALVTPDAVPSLGTEYSMASPETAAFVVKHATAANATPELDEDEEARVLVYGSPMDGFTFVGPVVPNDPDLDEYIDRELRDHYWWYAPMASLAEARAESNYIS